MNENFINTWVTNAELGRTNSLRKPIAERRVREGKTFDTSHALAQAIQQGWKKGSPVDCMVISHEFEVLGGIDYNFFPECLGNFEDEVDAYMYFLKESVAGKRPGLGNVILTPEQPSHQVLDTFKVPVKAHKDYTVVYMDATEYKNGGTLTIEIEVGRDDAIGIFHLLDGDRKLPSVEPPDGIVPDEWYNQESDEYKRALGALTQCWGIFPGETGKITHNFHKGQRFKLCATGDQWGDTGEINAFIATITVEERQLDSIENENTEISEVSASEHNIVLTKEQTTQQVLDIFCSPGSGYQDYNVINIDTTAFEDGGKLTIDIEVGGAEPAGSFDLYNQDAELPTEGVPEALESAWGVMPCETDNISYKFEKGEIFKLGATGDWFSKKGSINAFIANISIKEAE